MTSGVDERLLEAVNAIGSTRWSGRAFRYASARRDALSGEGARRHGGRWNPRGLFPAVYLGVPARACMQELAKMAEDNHVDVATQLEVPYKLHTIDIEEISVLDLRNPANRHTLGLDPEDISGPWETCQPIGHAAWFLEFAGILAPSATAPSATAPSATAPDGDLTLALFEHRVPPGKLQVATSEPLDVDLYERLKR